MVVDFADGIVGSLGTVVGDGREAAGAGRHRSFLESAWWVMAVGLMIGRIDARWGLLEGLQRMGVGISPVLRPDYPCQEGVAGKTRRWIHADLAEKVLASREIQRMVGVKHR